MSKDMEYPQDDKTVLYDRDGSAPSGQPLTNNGGSAKVEQLEQRMVYAARRPASGSFNVGLNPLVATASELLSEVVRLKHSETAEDIDTLKKRLSDGVRAFNTRIQYMGLDSNDVRTAIYVVCTVLDEAVVTTPWGKESQWSQMSLLSAFLNETFGGEKFFALLDRRSKNPIKNLEMLELMYLCLSLGFEGKYRVIDRGSSELEGIRDALFRQIRQLRGDVPRELAPRWEEHDQRHSPVRIVPWWSVALFTGVCLVVLYSGFAWVLGEQRTTVLQPFQTLEQHVALPRP